MANKKRKVTQATRNKLRRASKLYQKVRKNTQKELERRGQPIKGKELTAFVREKIYGEFKGLSPNEVRIADINDAVERAVTGTGVFFRLGNFSIRLQSPKLLYQEFFGLILTTL
jgi:hypothetical protein